MPQTDRSRLSRRQALGVMALSGVVLARSTATGQASPAGVLIAGGSWMQGQGVDVMGNGVPGSGVSYSTHWQCVELPQQRLYPKFGWPRVYAQDGGAHTIPEGSPGLQRFNPGSGYVPVPGDLIVEHGTGSNQYGHVAVVDRVEGNSIVAVEQNGSANGWHVYSYNASNYSGGYGAVKAVLHAPQNNFTNPGSSSGAVRDGDFVSYGGHVYRIAGGAPIYVSSWAHMGGQQQVRALSAGEFNALRTYPSDGTLISGQAPGNPEHGTVYVVAGGAPIYVTSFDHVGNRSPINVDLAAVHNAGGSGPWARLRKYPLDGTLISGQAAGHAEHGTVYVIAGGAPIYVASFDHVGNRPATNVSLAAIHNAGGAGRWEHLRKYPANGTLISAQSKGHAEHGTVYVIAGGAPIYVSSFNHVGKGQPITNVSLNAVHNAGGTGRWEHLRKYPADGTLVTGHAPGRPGSGTVFVVAGGAPICVYNWANIGGSKPVTDIDLVATENAGKGAQWRYLLNYPVNGTVLRGHSSGKYYLVTDGRPLELPAPSSSEKGKAVSVDQDAINRAGEPLTHLRGRQDAVGAAGGGSSFGS